MHPLDPRFRSGTPVLHEGGQATVRNIAARLDAGVLVTLENEVGQTTAAMAHSLQINWDVIQSKLRAISDWFRDTNPTALPEASWLASFISQDAGGPVSPGKATAFVSCPGNPLEIWQRLEYTSLFCPTTDHSIPGCLCELWQLRRRSDLLSKDHPPALRAIEATLANGTVVKRPTGDDSYFVLWPARTWPDDLVLYSASSGIPPDVTIRYENGSILQFADTRPK